MFRAVPKGIGGVALMQRLLYLATYIAATTPLLNNINVTSRSYWYKTDPH
jgi:hypothetical protein